MSYQRAKTRKQSNKHYWYMYSRDLSRLNLVLQNARRGLEKLRARASRNILNDSQRSIVEALLDSDIVLIGVIQNLHSLTRRIKEEKNETKSSG